MRLSFGRGGHMICTFQGGTHAQLTAILALFWKISYLCSMNPDTIFYTYLGLKVKGPDVQFTQS